MQTKIEKIGSSSAIAVKIIEAFEEEDLGFLSFREKLSLANISHPEKKKEWAAARQAIYQALQHLHIPYPGFFKDEHGKPQSMNGQGFASISHTKGYAAAIYHRELPVGIDIEYVREKIIRLGEKFLSSQELSFLSPDPVLYTMAWSAKETIFKCHGKRDIVFKENILLEPFSPEATQLKGKIRGTRYEDHHYLLKVIRHDSIILTYTIW